MITPSYESTRNGQTPWVVNGVRIDTLLGLPERTVIDQIPEGERGKYLLRGANVGKFALNLMTGKFRVNPFDDLYMHVSRDGGYDIALSNARTASTDFDLQSQLSQFGPDAYDEWQRLTGSNPDHFPGIVFGIPRDFESRLVIHPQTIQRVIGETVPFGRIDPYSQEFLGKLFEMDLTRH